MLARMSVNRKRVSMSVTILVFVIFIASFYDMKWLRFFFQFKIQIEVDSCMLASRICIYDIC